MQSKHSVPSLQKSTGVLYVIATPIGNLKDITQRAIDTLKSVDFILAEDTRYSQRLLTELGIKKPLLSLHEHNEREKTQQLIGLLKEGQALGLISDAGTPLISDPGFFLVHEAKQHGISVVPIPGPSALIAALSVSGLPTDKFCFEGFLSAKKTARRTQLEKLLFETRTLIFYEAPHRLLDTVKDLLDIFGKERKCVLARELTKKFETILDGSLQNLYDILEQDSQQLRGECVLIIEGYSNKLGDDNNHDLLDEKNTLDVDSIRILKCLINEMNLTKAASLASKITGKSKRSLYDYGLALKGSLSNDYSND